MYNTYVYILLIYLLLVHTQIFSVARDEGCSLRLTQNKGESRENIES